VKFAAQECLRLRETLNKFLFLVFKKNLSREPITVGFSCFNDYDFQKLLTSFSNI
jgi:hypothetical protein